MVSQHNPCGAESPQTTPTTDPLASPAVAPVAPVASIPVAPPLPADIGAALLAEIRALRTDVQASRAATVEGFAVLTERVEDATAAPEPGSEDGESELETPASVARISEAFNRATDTPDLTDGEAEKARRHFNGYPPPRRGESDEEYEAHLRRLSPMGPKGKNPFERRSRHEARRHDGAAAGGNATS